MRSLRSAALLVTLLLASCEETTPPVVPTPPTPPTPTVTAQTPPPPPPSRPAPRADASLVHRQTLFGNPDHISPRVSPDGKRIAFLAPEGGVLNVWVAPADDLKAAKAVTHDKKRPIRQFYWAYTNEHVLYLQDAGGDENFHVFAADLKTGDAKDLTPIEGVRAELFGVSQRHPGEILVGTNKRDPKLHDVQLVELKTGKMTLVQENAQGFASYDIDDDFHVRFGEKMNADGSVEIFARGAKKDDWKTFTTVPTVDVITTEMRGFDGSGKTAYLVDSRGRDTGALVAIDAASGKQKVLFEDPKADVSDVLLHPKDLRVQAVASNRERKRWTLLDKSLEEDFAYLRTVAQGDLEISSRTLDDKRWVVSFLADDGPAKYFLYDRGKTKKTTFLFVSNEELAKVKTLTKMHPVVIKARDGLELVSYLSLPKSSDPSATGRPSSPLPMVLVVHGGPWARDMWGYNSWHQWLADRGYAVLSVNYRGSTGLGKKFVNAGDKEWAGKMHEDLLDAVEWAITEKVTTRDKVAIMGGSYGGYATLVGLTFTPDEFACGVDIVGPSSLRGLLDRIPPYWAPQVALFRQRVGDNTTEEGKKLLDARSPLFKADQIKRPLLIAQGKNDPRVKEIESSQIVSALTAKSIPVTYVLYPDEGHGFARPENRTSFNAVVEIFLAQCLGGVYEPIGDDFKGATITVPSGADQIYGLSDALRSK